MGTEPALCGPFLNHRHDRVFESCCPFCGLVCDDVHVRVEASGGRVERPDCARARRLFAVPTTGQARIGGEPVETDAALRAAAAALRRARRPLIGGLACDVAGQRAALDLAEQVGGVVEHMNGVAQFRNWLAFQDGGWMTTTLSEVRNRADLIVFAGTDASRYPRFFERCVDADSQFGPLERSVVTLGAAPAGGRGAAHAVERTELATLFADLRIRLAGRTGAPGGIGGVPAQTLDALLAAMKAARYGVLVWSAAELDFPHADLTVQAMADLIRDLNRETRWAGLPLGGSDGDTSASQVCTWRTGYPLRVGFEPAGPRYEPLLFDAARLLAAGEADALLWISAFDPERAPPEAACPRIVLGRPDLRLDGMGPGDVFIPVAVPGVHHAGILHRMDGVVSLPLQGAVPSALPSAAQALAALQREMTHAAA